MRPALPSLFGIALLAGCAQDLNEIGREPSLSPVGSGLNAGLATDAAYPSAPQRPVKRFSLWNDRQSQLFTDARALSVGDILTVDIALDDKAQFNNQSNRNRSQGRTMGLGAAADLGGAGSQANANLDLNSQTTFSGDGATVRSEKITLSVAAVVTDILPNGNLVIRGSQEVRVNAELRVLTIAGIVRPEDIGASNTIRYDRIAEARIAYGGRGRQSEVQQPSWGTQVIDALSPI